ncbi:putative adipose-regulatory protein (Seipin) domain-containing protein [Phthorimaea operculella]|nr:putative adipose-regulatory protein (Seipin) domain-containing protein [Phthorimaea operculella]
MVSRSRLHQLLRTLVLAPLLLAGVNEEKQQLQVELFSDFEEDQVGNHLSRSFIHPALVSRSRLHQLLRTLLLAGVNEEKQQLQVELFSDFEEDQVGNYCLSSFISVHVIHPSSPGVQVSAASAPVSMSYIHPALVSRSWLHQLLLTGVNEEKQQLQVELFSDFEEDQVGNHCLSSFISVQVIHPSIPGVQVSAASASAGRSERGEAAAAVLVSRSRLHQLLRTLVQWLDDCLRCRRFRNIPVTDAYVELQSRWAQVYACELHIEAHFQGLRYVMFHWPKISAAIGISTNLFFVSLVFILSWYHLQDGLPDFVKFQGKRSDSSERDPLEDTPPGGGKLKLEKEIKLERDGECRFYLRQNGNGIKF